MSSLRVLLVVFLVCSFLAVTMAQSDNIAALYFLMNQNRNRGAAFGRRSPLPGLMQWLMLDNMDYF